MKRTESGKGTGRHQFSADSSIEFRARFLLAGSQGFWRAPGHSFSCSVRPRCHKIENVQSYICPASASETDQAKEVCLDSSLAPHLRSLFCSTRLTPLKLRSFAVALRMGQETMTKRALLPLDSHTIRYSLLAMNRILGKHDIDTVVGTHSRFRYKVFHEMNESTGAFTHR